MDASYKNVYVVYYVIVVKLYNAHVLYVYKCT